MTKLALRLILLFALLFALPVSADYTPDPTTPRSEIPKEYQFARCPECGTPRAVGATDASCRRPTSGEAPDATSSDRVTRARGA